MINVIYEFLKWSTSSQLILNLSAQFSLEILAKVFYNYYALNCLFVTCANICICFKVKLAIEKNLYYFISF